MENLPQGLPGLDPKRRELLALLARRGGFDLARAPISPVSRAEEVFPLSFAQERLWFLDQLASGPGPGDTAGYNLPSSLEIRGALDTEAFRRTFTEIVRRHEILRTTYEPAPQGPVQRISPPAPVPVPVIDLSGLPEAGAEPEAARLRLEETLRPFDLERGPLLRVRLLRRSRDRHDLVTAVHHIATDGWSAGILVREIAELYCAFVQGLPSPLPPLAIQYVDFAQWQRHALEGPLLRGQVDFWKERLREPPPPLELPADRARTAGASQRGVRSVALVPQEAVVAFRALARREESTIFMALAAVFETLLHRLTGQPDLALGTPVAGRNRMETEALIGLFVNTLVLRSDLRQDPPEGPTFRELLARVRKESVGAFGHQDLPFEKLVEELQPERDLSHTPLFQALFVLQNTPVGTAAELPGLTLEALPSDGIAALFDLTLTATEGEAAELGLNLTGSADRFDAATVARFLGHLVVLLTGAAADPDRRLSDLPLLSPPERHQVLQEWNDAREARETDESGEPLLHRLFEAQAARTPERLAVSCGGTVLTYRELDGRADLLARDLRGLGVGPETCVGLVAERSPELIVGILGILKAGGAYVPIDPEAPRERRELLIADARISVRVEQGKAIGSSSPARAPLPAHGANLAYVIYTSGSTGRPKGVLVSHANAVRLFRATQTSFGFGADDVWTLFHSPAFDFSVWEIWGALLYGGRLIVVPAETCRSAEAFLALLAAEKVTVLNQTPSAFAALAQAEEGGAADLSALRWVLFGGDALQPVHIASWLQRYGDDRPRLVNLYGITETTVHVTLRSLRKEETQIRIGRPIPDLRLYILDRFGGSGDLRPAPIGVPGELCVGGPGVARGYLGLPDRTAERFIPDAWSGRPGERLYRSGDLGRFLPDGDVEYLGRADHQLKIRGYRIEPGEIEAALAEHPEVEQAVVMAVQQNGDLRLAAWVVPRNGEVPAEELRSFLEGRLPAYMVPAAFAMLDRLPLTPHGKVDRRALVRISPAVRAAAGYEAPRTPEEETIAGLFAELLGIERAGIHDGFFDLGGHSLLAGRLAARIREQLASPLPLRHVFESPTPAGLACAVEALRAKAPEGTAPPPLWPAPPGAERPLSFAQQRLWFLDRLEPGGASYNIPLAVRLSGELDPAVLKRCLGEIERRHQVLRTAFPAVDGRATQVVHPPRRPLPRIDLTGLPRGERLPEARRLARREAALPFDLAQGPVFRTTLLHLGRLEGESDEHAALFTLHHIVADGWALGVLVQELGTLYEAFAAGRPSPLPELPVQYSDFAAWQRRWLEGEALERQLAYWRRQLAGDLPPLDLPADRPRPPLLTHAGAAVPFWTGAVVAEPLRELARRQGATTFMTLLAAFQALLHRITGQDDVIVGTPAAGLGSAQAEALIGLFTNMLVLRTGLGGDPAFPELLRRTRETAQEAFFHADVPFERLVEELRPERDISRAPFFQVMFAFQNTPQTALDLPGLSLAPMETGGATARYDLTLELGEGPGGIGGRFEFNTDLFDAATIARLAGHFETLLEGIAADPHRRLSELPLQTAPERHQILAEWNDTTVPRDKGTIHGRIEEQAARTPEAMALAGNGRSLSYAELDGRAESLARHLCAIGVGPEDRVGVCLHRSPELVVALLGVLKAGAAYVPLDPGYPEERLAFVAEDALLSVVIVEDETADRLGSAAPERVVLPLSREDGSADGRGGRGVRGDGAPANTTAYVIHTSGSTGRPKGVVVGHANVLNFFDGLEAALGPAAAAPGAWLAVTSAAFDISVLELLWTLTRGFTVVVQPDRGKSLVPARRPAAPVRGIDFSLFYFAADESAAGGDPYRLLLEGARFADRNGFSAVWTPERHFHAFGGLYPSPPVTAAAVAGVTERLEIRAGSVVIPLHNPIRVAEEWALVDNLAGGRVGISFASGWHVNDFVLAPEAFHDRKAVMLRGIDTVRRLWRGEPARVPGGTGEPVDVRIYPRPLRSELPVWVTAAGSPETFRAAGEIGAGVLTHLLGQDLDDLAAKIAAYREAFRGTGTGHVTLMLHAFVGRDLDEVRETVRRPFKGYLRSSLGLLRELMRGLGAETDDLETLSEAELDPLLSHAFDRYFETAGLMGTPETCLETVERLKAIGVDEIACLIDFGVETETALAALDLLAEVRRRSQPASQEEMQDEEDGSFAVQVERYGITHLQCTPSMAGMLAADPESLAALGRLRALLVGGEALQASLAGRLPAGLPGGLHNLYGPTETTIWSSTWRVEAGEAVSLGRPIANTGLYIVDPRTASPLPIGVPGELWIGGAGVARGYLGRPELTAERFLPDPFSGEPGARLYRTGDLVRLLPDGRLDFRGRLDHQVKVRGHRIEPGEVEAALLRHPAVRECVVTARRAGGEEGEVRLAAYLVPEEGRAGEITTAGLRSFLESRVPEPLVPSAFVTLAELPRTPNGKLDRRALPKLEGDRLGVTAAWVAPRNELERTISSLWQEALGVERVGIQDNFFELGGTSFTLAQVHSRLRASLERDFSMVELFRHPTVGALARHLAGTAEDAAVPAEPRLDEAQARGGSRAERMEQRRQARQSFREVS